MILNPQSNYCSYPTTPTVLLDRPDIGVDRRTVDCDAMGVGELVHGGFLKVISSGRGKATIYEIVDGAPDPETISLLPPTQTVLVKSLR